MKNSNNMFFKLFFMGIAGLSLLSLSWGCESPLLMGEEKAGRMPAATNTPGAEPGFDLPQNYTARSATRPSLPPEAYPAANPVSSFSFPHLLKIYCIRPTGKTYGLGDGSDWNNAFSGMPDNENRVWQQLTEGGIFYIAGGMYKQHWEISHGGSSNEKRLIIKRATATEHGTNAGWQAVFDSQIIIDNGAINLRRNASYLTIDGAVPDGIRMQGRGNFRRVYGYCYAGERMSGIVVKNLDIQGPGLNLGEIYGQSLGIQFTGRDADSISDITISQCKIYSFPSALVKFNSVRNFLLEKSVLHDSTDTINHEDFLIADGSDGTIRWNVMYNTEAQGIYIRTNGAAPWYIHGNILYQEKSYNWHTRYTANGGGVAICGSTVTPDLPPIKNIFVYNNVIAGYRQAFRAIYSGSVYNNIFYDNYALDLSTVVHDNNWFSGNSSYEEAAGIAGGTASPFIDAVAFNYHLQARSTAVNKGRNLGNECIIDFDGRQRGNDGIWDIGAYEY